MNIQICKAYIVTESGKSRLTKSVAKQFPVSSAQGKRRSRRLETGKPVDAPICKIVGKTLGEAWDWLYLVPGAAGGYVWVPVLELMEEYVELIRERGGDVDNPADIPLVIL